MISSSPGTTGVTTASASRSVQVAAQSLRNALATANSSPTLQEGLYRAYTTHLSHLDDLDGIPQALGTTIHEVLTDLGSAFGFDETTGAKIAASTLGDRQAASILAHLEAIASNAEAIARDAGTAAEP